MEMRPMIKQKLKLRACGLNTADVLEGYNYHADIIILFLFFDSFYFVNYAHGVFERLYCIPWVDGGKILVL